LIHIWDSSKGTAAACSYNTNMTNSSNLIPDDLFGKMFNDRSVRTAITRESHLYFFHFYLAHYVSYATAPFQKEIFALTEDDNIRKLFIVAFRGSGKSTIITTSYPIWSILGRPKKKFVLILCQTKVQAKQHMMNLRRELETNILLKNDLGPFQDEPDEWGSGSLVFSNLNARITVASSEQSIRGLRHGQHRPDLVILDDVEDIASTKTREGRDKTYQWITGEVIPAGDKNTKYVVIGNLLHEDSLLMRLRQNIREERINGTFKSYPLIGADDQILWPGKYPDMEAIETERKNVGNDNAWQREYLLKIIPADDQVIYRDWIHYWDVLPDEKYLRSIRIGMDLAISEKETADYTAMVMARLYKDDKGKVTIFIDPIVINKRMEFPDTVQLCKELDRSLSSEFYPEFAIEDVGYQRSLPQMLQRDGLKVRAVRIGSQDKRSRLVIASHRIKSGQVLFASKGNEQLISQLVNFGIEKHDDIADAFTILMLDIIDHPIPPTPSITWINLFGDRDDDDNLDGCGYTGGHWQRIL